MDISEFVKEYNYIFENKIDNPDDFKSDDMDKKGDDYEKRQEEIKKFFSTKDSTEKIKEAMSVDDILKRHEERKANGDTSSAEGSSSGSLITEITVNEMYDGYVNATVIRSDGSKENVELEIPEEDIEKMYSRLEEKQKEDDDILTQEDACAACVYLQVEKNADEKGAIKWYFGKKKHDIGDWKFYDDLDMSMAQDMRGDSYSSIWNTGASNSSYNKLDMDSHDEDGEW